MFQHVVRWTFFITIWKKYKGQLLTTFAYLIGLLLISMVHKDYLDYVAVANEGKAFVSTSFLIKWVAYILLTGIYFWLFGRFSKPAVKAHEDLGFLKKFAAKKQNRNQNHKDFSVDAGTAETSQSAPDPFANIRKKEKLRSEADLIIEQHKKS
jgi:hypothetical protein